MSEFKKVLQSLKHVFILESTADPDEMGPHCLPKCPYRVCIIQRDKRASAFEIVQTSLVSKQGFFVHFTLFQSVSSGRVHFQF